MDAGNATTHLLLIDDDLKLCRLVRQYLEPLGYSVSLAHNGEDGLRAALAGTFDAIVLDVMMPKLDGFEVLKRLRAKSNEPVITVGDLIIESASRTASLAGQLLTLTAVEFDLLLSLARSAGRVKTRERLLIEVAERDFEAFDRSIDVHISSIRRKLGDDPKAPRFIQTIRSVGYLMLKPGVTPNVE